MRKFMKVCGVTALTLILGGLLIGAIAWRIQGPEAIERAVDSVTGGKVHVALRDADQWGVFIGETVRDKLEDLDESAEYDIAEDIRMDFDEDAEILTGDVSKRIAGEDIHNLEIAVGACQMVLRESEDADFHLDAEHVGKMQCYVRDRELHIKAIRPTDFNGKNNCRIYLSVPRAFSFDNVEVEMGAGQLETGDIAAEKIEIEVGAGKILCGGLLRADETELKIGAGEMEISEVDTGKLEAEIGMGALKLSGNVRKKAEIECSMGGAQIELAGGEKDYNYALDAAAGSIRVGDHSTSGPVGEKKIDNRAACDIAIKCSMGTVEISFKE